MSNLETWVCKIFNPKLYEQIQKDKGITKQTGSTELTEVAESGGEE